MPALFRRPFQDSDGGGSERHSVLAPVLHALGRDGPNPGGEVDLVPVLRAASFIRPRRGQQHELQRAGLDLGARPELGDEIGNGTVRERAMVHHAGDAFAVGQQMIEMAAPARDSRPRDSRGPWPNRAQPRCASAGGSPFPGCASRPAPARA